MTGRLAALDERVVPWVAFRLRRVLGVRWPSRRWLVGGSAIAVLAAFGAVTASRASPPAVPRTELVNAFVGPVTGESVGNYAQAASGRLRALLASAPAASTYALIDLSSYESPSWLLAQTRGLRVQLIYVRVHVPGLPTEVHPIQVNSLSELPIDLEGISARAAALARYTAAEINAPGSTEPSRAALRLSVRALLAEAHGIGPACTCIYALAAFGPVGRLAELAGGAGVRVVDPAPPSATFADIGFQPILPEINGAFPADGVTPDVRTVP
ncbi:MAG TPA: hypothetical protein VNG13_05270 [Mycobacteriales bacterium]|nr:hypothetical protein [Mycobacteriales bacterium]